MPYFPFTVVGGEYSEKFEIFRDAFTVARSMSKQYEYDFFVYISYYGADINLRVRPGDIVNVSPDFSNLCRAVGSELVSLNSGNVGTVYISHDCKHIYKHLGMAVKNQSLFVDCVTGFQGLSRYTSGLVGLPAFCGDAPEFAACFLPSKYYKGYRKVDFSIPKNKK